MQTIDTSQRISVFLEGDYWSFLQLDKFGTMRIAFVHPDLGLGGAERLIIDAALSLQSLGHDCRIFTPFQHPSRTFDEVAPPNPVVPVTVVNTHIPRTCFTRLHALLAMLRCSIVALHVCLFHRPHVAIVDLVSAPLFIFAAFRIPTLFYCHFPDRLLAASLLLRRNEQQPLAKRLYRWCVDAQETLALRLASTVCCNSLFTAAAFKDVFPRLPSPRVVYPCVPSTMTKIDGSTGAPLPLPYILSLNRYEEKKNITLAVEAFARLVSPEATAGSCEDSVISSLQLIIAGGYDSRLPENVSYFECLRKLIDQYGLSNRVHLQRNVSDDERSRLICHARALVYTPRDEHFGIVPLEAMSAGIPVIAVNSGGPCESVLHGSTGLLCDDTPDDFARAICFIVTDSDRLHQMGARGKHRVDQLFSRDKLAVQLQSVLHSIIPSLQSSSCT